MTRTYNITNKHPHKLISDFLEFKIMWVQEQRLPEQESGIRFGFSCPPKQLDQCLYPKACSLHNQQLNFVQQIALNMSLKH